MAASYELTSYRQIHESARTEAYGNQIRLAVDAVESRALPGAAVVVAGFMAAQSWEYYQFEHTGNPAAGGAPVGRGQVLLASVHGSPLITRLVDTLDARQVFLYIPEGVSGAEYQSDLLAIGKGRSCHPLWTQAFAVSGLLTEVACTDATSVRYPASAVRP
jgi:hypothetical protein